MEWFSDYPKHYYLKPDDTGAEEARFLQKVLHLKKGHAVLDAPCGAGRITVCLAKAGIAVTGLDLAPSYVQRAKERFASEGLEGDFMVSDLRQIDFTEEFDGAFCWDGSFGFFSESENRDVVRRYARSLRPGGRFLIEQPSREWYRRYGRQHGRNEGIKGDIEFKSHWRPDVERTDTVFRNIRTGESWSMTVRHYTPAQYRTLFQEAGLELEAVYSSLNREPYRRGDRRIYVLGRKPK